MESESQPKKNTDGDWVIDIFNKLQKLSAMELDLTSSHRFCICQVPDSLTLGKLEAFVPKFVGLGPYHHSCKKMTVTTDLKLAAAKRVFKALLDDKDSLQQQVKNYSSDIKCFYHLDVKSEFEDPDPDLFRLLTIDGLFVLAFLTLNHRHPEGGFSYFLTGKLGMPLFNTAGQELTKNILIREVFMLENQIPFDILRQISGVSANNIFQPYELSLGSILKDFCIDHLPLCTSEEHPETPEDCKHLLDLMYQLTVTPEPLPKPNQPDQPPNEKRINPTTTPGNVPEGNRRCFYSICFYTVLFLGIPCFILWFIFKHIFKLLSGGILSISRLVLKALLVLYKYLKALASRLNPVFKAIHENLSNFDYPPVAHGAKFFKALDKVTCEQEEKSADDDDVSRVVMIHSVTELHRAGIIVKPAEAGISTIKFDDKKCELYLPCIKVDANSEVIMKNLVAYESLTKPSGSSLTFTRYVELMKAIVDTPEDVKLLVQGQIVHSELRYGAIADIFNGMGKSIRKNTKTPKLDKVIKKVNAKFDAKRRRKRIFNRYTSAKLISVVGGLVFLALTAMQTYCSLYNCSRSWKKIVLVR